MRRLATAFLAVVYAALGLGVAVWLAVIAEFHCSNRGCEESTSDWTQAYEAWQWDAILWLGLLGGLAALVTLALMVPQHPLFPMVGLVVHAALLLPAFGLMVASDEFSAAKSVLFVALVLGSGGAVIYLRSSRHMGGTRFE
jgi:hypothetical protein